jgi:hypothetical protein
MASNEDLKRRLRDAFASDAVSHPTITLRAADAIDSYCEPMPFDAEQDLCSPQYLNAHAWGIPHLDPASWRHYLAALGELALDSLSSGNSAVSGLIQSLRPPDRDPPRLQSLDKTQETAIRELLEVLAFSPESIWQAEACQALEEWWIENALYRNSQ